MFSLLYLANIALSLTGISFLFAYIEVTHFLVHTIDGVSNLPSKRDSMPVLRSLSPS